MKSSTWDFVGIRREPEIRKHPQQHQLTRWRIPFLARGAISTTGSGHWRALGLWYTWHDRSDHGYAKERVLHIGSLAAIAYEKQGSLKSSRPKAWQVTFAKPQWPIRGLR